MAEVQPKLVHKQFNSPIGLYSENNIKETINREIKAVGGIGIDLDDQISSKPSHLANSYVLKMLQEEESERYLVRNRKQQRSRYQKTNNKNINNNNNGINHENQYQQQRQQQQQKQRNNNGIKNNETNDNETINSIKSGGNLNEKNILPQQLKNNNMNVSGISERQSRPRHRFEQDKKITVDRNTVLKINRRHQNYYRDLSWPPPNNREPRSLSEDNCYYFDETIRKKHNIDNIRNLFEFGTIYERRASSFPKEIKNLPTTNLQKQDENFLSPDEINNKYNNKDAGQKFQSNFHENFITSDERISSSLPSTFEKSNKKNSIYNNNNKITTSNIPATTIGIKAPLTNNIIIRTPKSITIDQPLPPSMNKSLSSKMNENVICNSKNKVFNINNQMVSKSNSEIDEINNIERIPKQQQREEQNNQEYNRKDIINGNTIGKNFKIKSLNGKKNSAQHESTTIKSTHANKSDFSKCPIIVTRQPNNKNFTSNDNSNIAVVKLITDSNAKTTKINNALVNSSILTKDSNYQKITTTDDDDKNKINENNSNNLYKINQYQKIPTSLYSIKFQHLLSSSSSPLSSPIVFSSNRETEIVDVPTKISCSSSLSFKNLNEIITSNRQINNIPIPSDTKNLISQITLPLLTSSSLSLLPYSSPSSSTTETSIPIENINSKENNIFVSTQPPKTFVPEAKIQHKTVTFNNNNCSNNTDDGKINSEMLNKVNFNKIEKDDDNNILYMPSSLSSLSQENIKVNSKVKVMEQPSNMKHSKIMDNDSCIYTSATMCSPSYSSYSSFAAASTTNQRSHENLEFYKQKKLRDENLVQSVPSSSSLSSSSYFTPAATTNETIQNQESNIISNNMKKQILLKEIRERNNKSYIKNNQENNSNNNKKFQNNTKNYDSTNTIAVQKENILTKGYDTSHLNNDNDDVDHHDNDKISTYYSENEFNKNKNTTTFKTKIVDSPTKDQNDNTIPIKKLFDNNKFDIRDKNYITYTDGEYIYVPKKIPKNHIEMDEHIKEISKCQNMTDNNEKSCIKYNNNDNDSNEISNLIQKNLTIRAKSVPETKYSKYDNIEIGDITNYNSTSSNTDYKYEIIEKSIAEDLRRIDEFIETSLLKSSLSYDDYYNKYIRERLETPPIPPPRRHNIKYNILNSSSSSNVNNNEITSLPNTNTILVLETPLPIIKQMFIKTNSAIRSRSISPTTLIKSTTAATALKTLTTKSLDYKNDNNITSSSIYSSTSSSSTFLTTSNTPTTSCNIISTTHPIYSENNDFLKNLKEIYDLNIYKNNNGTTSTTATIIPLQCTIKSKAKEENIHPTNIMITESSISVPSSITSTSSSSLICEKFNISNAFNINNNDIDNLNNVYKEEKNIMNEKSNIDINGLNEIKGITNNSLVCKDNPIDYKQQEHNINIIDTSDLTLPSPPPPPLSYSISLTPTKNIITTFSTSSDSSSAAFASSTNYNSNTTGYSSSLMVNQMENMPVVENVLTDLDNISRELNNNFNNTNNNKMENHQHLNKIKKPNQQKVVKHQKEEIIQDTTIQQKKQHKLNLVESTNSNELTFSDYLTGTTTASIDSDNNINENVITNSKEITKTSTSSSSSTLLSSSTKTLEETTKMAKKSLQSSLSSSSYNKIMNYTDNNSYRGNIQIDDNYNNINNIKTNTIITTTTNAGTTAAISASTISSSNKETYNKKLLNQQTTTDTTLDFSRGENNNSISMENISSTDDIKNAVDRKMNENTRYYKMYAEYPPTLMKSNKKTNNNNNIDNKIVCQNQQEEQQQQQNYNKQQKHHQYFSEQNYTDKSYDNITSRNDFSDDNYHSLSTHHKIDNKKSKDITTNIHNENINVKELLEKTSNEVNKNDITDTEIKTSRTSLILSSPSTPTPTSLHKPPTFKLPKVLVTTSSLSIDANDDSDIPFPSPVLSIYDNIDDINQSTIIDNNNKKNSKSQGTDKSNATLFTTPSTTASSSTPSSKITDNLTKIQCKKELDYISENNINKANNNEQILTDEIFQSVSELEEFEHLHHIQQQNLKRLQKEIMLSKINVLNDSDYNENLLHKNERDKLEMEQQQEEELKQKSNQIQLQQQQQTEQQIDVRSLETKNNNVNQIADQKNQQHQYHKRSPIDNTITTATITTITDSATTNSTNVNENYLKTKLYSEQCNQQIENISAAVNINDNEKLKESYNNNNIENSIMNEKKLTTNYNNIQQQQYSTIRDNIGVDDDGGNNNKSKINDIIINQKMSSNQYTSSSISENLKFEKSEQEYEKPQKMRKQQKLLEENSQNKTHLYLKNHQLDEHFQQQHEEQKQQQELHLESTNEIIDVCNSNKIKTKIQQKQQQQDTRQQRHEKRWSQETNNQTSGINVNNIENRDINRSKISQKELELNQINENQKLDQILQLSTNISTNATVDAVTLSQTTTPPHTPTIILSTSKRQENQQKQPTKSIFDNTFEQNNIQNVTTNIEKQSKDYNLKNTESIDDDNNNADTTESRTGSRSSKHYISKKFFKIRSFSQPPPLEYFQSYSPDEVSLVRNFIEAVDDATMRNNSNSNAPPPSDYNYNIENFKSFLSPNHNKKIDISTSISSNEDMRSETEVNDKVGNNFKDINSSTITNTTTATTNTNTCTNFTNVSASYDDDSRLCDNNDYMNDIKNNFTIDNTQFQPVKDKEEQLEKSSNNIQIDDIEKNHQKQDLQDDLCFDNSNHEKTMILENHQDQQHSYYDYYSSDPNLFFKDDIDDKGQLSITKQHDEKDDECNQWDDEEGYKRVAWPPTPERKIIREFTPQPQSQGDTNQGAPYLNNTPQTNHLPQQPSNRYLSPQPQSQPQNQPYQSQPQQQPPYLKQQNPSQQSQSYPGQQYFPKQQQQPQQHQQPSSFPSVPQHNQQHPQVNSYPSPHPQQQPQQPNQMNQSGPTVGFAGGIPVKAIPGLSPNEPPQQQYQQQNYRPQSPSNPQQQQQSQPIFQAQHQRYQQPEQNSVPAPYYQQPSQSYPQQNQQQQYQNQIPQQYSQNPSNLYGGWSHVSAPKYNRQPEQQQQQQQQHPMYAPSQQQYNQPQQQQQYPPNYSSAPVSQFGQSQGGQVGGGGQPQYQQQYNEPQQPHSGIVTLRKDPPYTQKPAPTVVSQPAAKSLRGGSLMRGDLKWPPEDCRERMAAEAELQRQLQLGPANRPTRLPKDYSSFFAKHALSHYYPGYKIPPGTQHIYAEF